jgi:hypothetical protein
LLGKRDGTRDQKDVTHRLAEEQYCPFAHIFINT